MIEYVKGQIAELTPAIAVIDCHGVGYGLNISLNTFSALQGKQEAKLYVYEAIREDAYVLYGFSTRQERALFLLLISVSGIGGNTARMILSALTPAELVNVISSGNDKLLKTVKGIGLKSKGRQPPALPRPQQPDIPRYWKRPWPPLPCWASRPPPRKRSHWPS